MGECTMLLRRRFVFGFIALAFAGCGFANFSNRFSAEETESKTFNTKGSPRILVETFNGAIEVSIGSEDSVKANVTKRATGSSQDAADDDLDSIDVVMKQEADTIQIKAFV